MWDSVSSCSLRREIPQAISLPHPAQIPTVESSELVRTLPDNGHLFTDVCFHFVMKKCIALKIKKKNKNRIKSKYSIF